MCNQPFRTKTVLAVIVSLGLSAAVFYLIPRNVALYARCDLLFEGYGFCELRRFVSKNDIPEHAAHTAWSYLAYRRGQYVGYVNAFGDFVRAGGVGNLDTAMSRRLGFYKLQSICMYGLLAWCVLNLVWPYCCKRCKSLKQT